MRSPKLLALALITLAVPLWGCGGDNGPTGPGGGSGVTKAEGTWNSKNVDQNGVPSSRYYFEPTVLQSGLAPDAGEVELIGEAYFRWDGALEHVGSLTGTFSDDGTITWTTVMDQNGWEGTEVIEGKVNGSTFTGDYVVRALDGTILEEGSFSMEREPDPVALGPGAGVLGAAGPWRGAVLYLSLSDCNATGYLWTIVFDESTPAIEEGVQVGVNFTGTAAGRTFDGGNTRLPLSAFLGPLRATLTGIRYNDGRVEFSVAGQEMKGVFSGGLVQPEGELATSITGGFDGAGPCRDGTSNYGGFTLTSARLIEGNGQAKTDP